MSLNSLLTERFLCCIVGSGLMILPCVASAGTENVGSSGESNNTNRSGDLLIGSSASNFSNEVNSHNVPVKPASEKEQQNNVDTANAVNRLPGIKIEPKDLQPPAEEVPIRGFHPIKKMLQPVERLEKNSVQLQQQIMKLEGPIAGLQPPMLGLHKKMTAVEQKMVSMQGRLDNVGSRVDHVGSDIGNISKQMVGVRSDLSDMHKQINELSGPIKDLHKPLAEVAEPLKTIDQKLEKLAALLTTIVFMILVAAIAVAVGTPIAAILIYRYRRKLFPDMSDHEFPVAKPVKGGS